MKCEVCDGYDTVLATGNVLWLCYECRIAWYDTNQQGDILGWAIEEFSKRSVVERMKGMTQLLL